MSSDLSNSALTSDDVRLEASDVRPVTNSKRIKNSKRDQCQVSSEQYYAIRTLS